MEEKSRTATHLHDQVRPEGADAGNADARLCGSVCGAQACREELATSIRCSSVVQAIGRDGSVRLFGSSSSAVVKFGRYVHPRIMALAMPA